VTSDAAHARVAGAAHHGYQSPALAALVAHSTFQALPGFGQAARGHIALQHHGDPVWFRHLRLRPLLDACAGGVPAMGPA
jgi:hypothetical protein